MITIKVDSEITVYITREPGKDTYEMMSSDSQDHEELLASNLTTIKEVFDVLKQYLDVWF